MTCSERERDLALYASGDLQDAALERHVESCAQCCDYLDEMRLLLAGIAADAGPAAPAIATHVMRVIRRRRYGWAAFAGMAVAASVIVAALVSTVIQPIPAISTALHLPAVSAPATFSREPLRAAPKPHRARHRRPALVTPAEPVVVKLITDDPNVVIYWITD